jgi:hypothetical protein
MFRNLLLPRFRCRRQHLPHWPYYPVSVNFREKHFNKFHLLLDGGPHGFFSCCRVTNATRRDDHDGCSTKLERYKCIDSGRVGQAKNPTWNLDDG